VPVDDAKAITREKYDTEALPGLASPAEEN